VEPTLLLIFGFVYVGMLAGGIPGLALDRTGVALLGAIALVATGLVSPSAAWDAVDVPTISLLFGLMVVSAQLRLGGFYGAVTRRLAALPVSEATLLGLLVLVAGILSALLANDIVCLAMTPILVESCARRRTAPLPFLLALAAAANVGSAATLIGNPQNMLVGQVLGLSFGGYLLDAVVPSILGLGVVWWVTCRDVRPAAGSVALPHAAADAPSFDAWQTAKGLVVLGALLVAFLATDLPREAVTLAAAGALLVSRRTASRAMLGLVDWQLLVLFVGLFVVNHAVVEGGLTARALAGLTEAGIDPTQPAWLFGIVAVLSNLVSNVPAVMLLLPAASHPLAGAVLALSSTLAGNLLLVGSIANLIVADEAGRMGVRIGWREHARVGIPVTLVTLALAAAWLYLRARPM
jgi:Na+/H+ antiporter NhaD/arsenite permease-like protein